jgi:hypothetical protein
VLPLANHPGDWLISVAYAAPALIVLALVVFSALRRNSEED